MSTEIFKVGDPVFEMHLKWCTVLKPGDEMTKVSIDSDKVIATVPNENLSFTEYDLINGGWSQDRSVLNQPKKGDLVYVRDSNVEDWLIKRFSHIKEDGRYVCFMYQIDLEDYELNYDSDWNLLMRIVEQIQDIDITPTPDYKGYRIEIVPQGYVQIEGSGMQTIFKNVAIEGSLIKTVYAAVIQFIKWHNSQPN